MRQLPILVTGDNSSSMIRKMLAKLHLEEDAVCEARLYMCEMDSYEKEQLDKIIEQEKNPVYDDDVIPITEFITGGECLLYVRALNGFSQNALSFLSGVSQRTISAVETGKKKITVSQCRRIARVFGVDELLFID